MTIDRDTHIDTVFFVGAGDKDWLAIIYRQGDGPWEIECRIRYYDVDDDGNTGEAFDGKDQKRFFCGKAKDNSDASYEEGLKICHESARLLGAQWNAEVCEVPVKGGMDRFIETITAQPWAHVRVKDERSAWEG